MGHFETKMQARKKVARMLINTQTQDKLRKYTRMVSFTPRVEEGERQICFHFQFGSKRKIINYYAGTDIFVLFGEVSYMVCL